MSKEKANKRTSIIRLFRQLKGFNLRELQEKSGIHYNLISLYENKKATPSRETIIKLANGLEVKPDVILYGYGYLPDNEMKLTQEDPYYYMDKIQKMCKNHQSRYSEEDTNVDDLNFARTYDYIIKSMEENRKEDKSNT